MVKASLAHLPLTLRESKGRPRNRYSRVAPMRMLWPWSDGNPIVFLTILLILTVKALRVRGRSLLSECRYAKSAVSGGVSLTRKWFSIAANGSASLFCLAQYTSSLDGELLVWGEWNTCW